jgi:iron-sulfur cluster assembly accessory protein
MVVLSPDAKSALERLNQEHPDAVIRLKAQQVCDCGKIGFDLQWERTPIDSDKTERQGNLVLVYDEASAPYLEGLEVEYRNELMGKSFTFYNPNLKNGGGCGRELK